MSRKGHGDGAALPEAVDAEARPVAPAEREVDLLVRFELDRLTVVEQRRQQPGALRRGERRPSFQPRQEPVDAQESAPSPG
jgi:hypothetical protein